MKHTQLLKSGLETLLITNPDNIYYLTNFPATNHHEREAYLLLSHKANLFITDGRLIEQAEKIIDKRMFTLVQRTHSNKLTDIIYNFLYDNHYTNLGFEKSNLTVYEQEVLSRKLSKVKLKGYLHTIENLRKNKDNQEIACIKRASHITDKTYAELLPLLKLNVQEDYLVWKIKEIFHLSKATPAFEPIVAFGKNSSVPHYTSGSTKLKKNDIILIDMGARIHGYCSDLTRVISLGASLSSLSHMYDTVSRAHNSAVAQINKMLKQKTPVSAVNIDKAARDTIIKHGYPAIPHGTGHGVGIAIHEAPHIGPQTQDILQNGMVFTIEPGIYIPNLGGIRIEDLYTIQNDKLETLSHSPKETIII